MTVFAWVGGGIRGEKWCIRRLDCLPPPLLSPHRMMMILVILMMI